MVPFNIPAEAITGKANVDCCLTLWGIIGVCGKHFAMTESRRSIYPTRCKNLNCHISVRQSYINDLACLFYLSSDLNELVTLFECLQLLDLPLQHYNSAKTDGT